MKRSIFDVTCNMDKRTRYNKSKDRDAQFKSDVNEFLDAQLTVLKNPHLFTEETSTQVNEAFLTAFRQEYYMCLERQEIYLTQRIYARWMRLNFMSL